jgi:hypothetical protein
MVILRPLFYHRIVIGTLFRTTAVFGAMTIACIALMAWPSRSAAQGPPLPQTLNIEVEGMRITISYPEGWSAAQDANVYKLLNVPVEKQHTLDAAALDRIAHIMVFTEHRSDHAEAVRRLKEMEAETESPSTFRIIGGWPGLQRRHLAPKPQPGQAPLLVKPGEMVLEITTAVAAENLLVRLEGRLRPDALPEVIDQVEAIGRSLIFATSGHPDRVEQEIRDLRMSPRLGSSLLTPVPKTVGSSQDTETFEEAAGEIVRVTATGGTTSELEIAVSTDGQNIVIGSNFGFFVSTDAGQNFNPSTFISPPRPINGDPSLAIGRSGNFYAALIIRPNFFPGSTGIWVSMDGGRSFDFRADAFTCPANGPNVCAAPEEIPDQEHIAADRFNTAPGGDQVYSAWRHLDGRYGIVCSADSGTTWGTANFTRGDFPRITVGQDGFVYVVYKVSSTEIMLNKYKSCEDNASMLPETGFPTLVTMGAQDDVCPTPGLDRCGGKNVLNGPMVAVDDNDAQHIYVTHAVNTEFDRNTFLANDNVIVQDSQDGGKTWNPQRRVIVSGASKGRRFMPWVCAVDGMAHVSWYDRRAATAAGNDLTDYFRGSASRDAAGNLVAGVEVQVNEAGTADPQCASGWPGGVFSPNDSDSCSEQPQLAGFCLDPMTGVGSGTRCDFSDTPGVGTPPCMAGEICFATGGQPKYGDYNGNACAAGRLYLAWASATPRALGGIDTFFAVVRVVPALTLTVAIVGSGSGTVTSDPPGIDCPPDCQATYDRDTVVTLTPTPDPRAVFTGWSGDPDCADGVVTMDADKTCVASFELDPSRRGPQSTDWLRPDQVTIR